MGLFNARNLRKAKELLDKNRHKVGDVVEKAGTQLDKVSKGKTSNVTSKASDAAKKYSATGVEHHGVGTPAAQPPHSGSPSSPSDPDVARRQGEATGAMAGAANALTNLINKAADKVESSNADKASSGDVTVPQSAPTADAWPAPTGEIPRDDVNEG